jgi:hypothetical protein
LTDLDATRFTRTGFIWGVQSSIATEIGANSALRIDVLATCRNLGISLEQLLGGSWPGGSVEQRTTASHARQQKFGLRDAQAAEEERLCVMGGEAPLSTA